VFVPQAKSHYIAVYNYNCCCHGLASQLLPSLLAADRLLLIIGIMMMAEGRKGEVLCPKTWSKFGL
jgi:hypothetical protein